MTVKITELPLAASVAGSTIMYVIDPTGPTSERTTLESIADVISPTASQSVKGIVTIGTGINVDVNGVISVPTVTTISGNAGTVTNGVYTTGSYADPTWITSLAASKVGLGSVTNESKATMFASPTFTGTVSGVTATMVGLGSVTNESKVTMFSSPTFTGTVAGVTATHVGLGSVTNESKATMFASPTFTGTVAGVTAEMVGLGNVTNESKATMFSSPTFTEVPLAPTAIAGTNTTQVATTQFVRTEVSNLVNGAGPALDTLKELADALGSDANFSATISTALGLKAPLANPAFTGTPTGITATHVGLGNVTNESKATMFASPTFTGTVAGVTATHVGLGNVTNESKATMFASPTFTGTVTIPAGASISGYATSSGATISGASISNAVGMNFASGVLVSGFSDDGTFASNASNKVPVESAVKTYVDTGLALKANLASPTFTGTVAGVTATMVGLGNVTNESKATMFTSPTFTGTVAGVTATHVGLGNVTNESKATMFSSPTFTGTVSGVTATHVGLGNVTNESKATMFTAPSFTLSGNVGINVTNEGSWPAGIVFKSSGGTIASPTQTGNGNSVLNIRAQGHIGSGGVGGFTTLGWMEWMATEAITADNRGSQLGLYANRAGGAASYGLFWNGTIFDTTQGSIKATGITTGGSTTAGTLTGAWALTGSISGVTSTMVGLGNVTNESKATMFTSPTFTGTVSAPTLAVSTNTASTSNTTGSLTVAGGVGAVGRGYFGEGIYTNYGTAYGQLDILSTRGSAGLVANNSEFQISIDGSNAFVLRMRNGAPIVFAINDSIRAKINETAASSSTTTGALVVTGGVGISGNLNVGGTVSGVTATMVGLGNVTNESKATMFSSPTFTGTVSGVTATHVGLGSVTNESKATMFSSPTFTGTVSGVTATHVGLSNVGNYTVNQNVGTANDVTHNTVTAAAFYYSSDATLKTNIGTLTNYWETLDALRPVSFDWISSGKKDLGLLAQDVQSVMPESVTTTDAGTLAISSSGIIANLVAAVKDLKRQVEELTKQLKG